MCLIPCAENCIYQKDGYCDLDIPGNVTNSSGTGCIHFIECAKFGKSARYTEKKIPSEKQK